MTKKCDKMKQELRDAQLHEELQDLITGVIVKAQFKIKELYGINTEVNFYVQHVV